MSTESGMVLIYGWWIMDNINKWCNKIYIYLGFHDYCAKLWIWLNSLSDKGYKVYLSIYTRYAVSFSVQHSYCVLACQLFIEIAWMFHEKGKKKKPFAIKTRYGIKIHSSSKSKFKFLIKQINNHQCLTIIEFILDIELSNPISLPFQSVRCHSKRKSQP